MRAVKNAAPLLPSSFPTGVDVFPRRKVRLSSPQSRTFSLFFLDGITIFISRTVLAHKSHIWPFCIPLSLTQELWSCCFFQRERGCIEGKRKVLPFSAIKAASQEEKKEEKERDSQNNTHE